MMLVDRGAVTRCAVMLVLVATFPGCAPNAPELSGTTRAQLLGEATGNYTYGPERAPVPVDASRISQPGGVLPSITIATAARTSATGRVGSNRFLARLTVTGGAYARMGLAPGVNYVWRDSAGSGSHGWMPARGGLGMALWSVRAVGLAQDVARTLIVPEDPAYPMRWLQHEADHTPLSSSATALPRLVSSSMGYGMCDNGCGGGHCVTFQAAAGAVAEPVPTAVFAP